VKLRRQPEPPVNVRLVLRDGRTIPLDTVFNRYEGKVAVWRVVNAPPYLAFVVFTGYAVLTMDELPGETSIEVVDV
jgi:hypothetical protein